MFRYKGGTSIGKKMKAERVYKEEMARIAKSDTTVFLVERFLALVVETLKDEFGFGPVRLERFKKRLELKLDCITLDYVNWSDILKEND
ncbi:hypothetical protein [Anaerococcus sp. Marseille-P3625]|uniref:hypothetical protein n=1 Tax=Anaerococcus sp. Marseille-P3625 TaxID=1977277 RepID=UPI000C08023E|nr:hypothetical protein [Anaerococcus sp. Marseille-P3625]